MTIPKKKTLTFKMKLDDLKEFKMEKDDMYRVDDVNYIEKVKQ